MQKGIESPQVGRFNMHVRRRGQPLSVANQFFDGLRRKRRALIAGELRQRAFDEFFALGRRQFQYPQVLLDGRSLREPRRQLIEGEAKTGRREERRPITIAGQSARLSHQPIDDVAVVDLLLAAAEEPRQRLHQLIAQVDFERRLAEENLHLPADQAAVNRVDVRANVDQARRRHSCLQTNGRLECDARQRTKRRQFAGHRLPRRVATSAQRLQELVVFFARGEVATAAQTQFLIERRLKVAMR
jgi:hypothetical protein